MVEADDIQFGPLQTSVLYIKKVFEPLVCCLKDRWVHPHTIPQAKLAPDLGIYGNLCGVRMMLVNHG